jgi:hypothetical protein
MHNNFNNQLKTKPDMRKKLYVLLALLAFCASAYAVDYTGMDVYSVSGEKLQELWFNHYSSITFDATTGEITFVGDGKVGENTGKVCSSISYGWGNSGISGIFHLNNRHRQSFSQCSEAIQTNRLRTSIQHGRKSGNIRNGRALGDQHERGIGRISQYQLTSNRHLRSKS